MQETTRTTLKNKGNKQKNRGAPSHTRRGSCDESLAVDDECFSETGATAAIDRRIAFDMGTHRTASRGSAVSWAADSDPPGARAHRGDAVERSQRHVDAPPPPPSAWTPAVTADPSALLDGHRRNDDDDGDFGAHSKAVHVHHEELLGDVAPGDGSAPSSPLRRTAPSSASSRRRPPSVPALPIPASQQPRELRYDPASCHRQRLQRLRRQSVVDAFCGPYWLRDALPPGERRVPDHVQGNCTWCLKGFSSLSLVHRYHCDECGCSVCSGCSSERSGSTTRVCVTCPQ